MDRNYRERLVRIFTGAILIASLGSLAACGGGGGGGSTPPPPPASGSVVWSLASVTTGTLDNQTFATAMTGTSIIVVGYDSSIPVGDDEWRIEKRALSDGALAASFGTMTGTIVSNPSYSDINSSDKAYAVAVDSEAMYVVGFDSTAGDDDWGWRIEKRDLATGATITSFGTSGTISENNSVGLFMDDAAFAVAVDSSPTGTMYVVGFESPAGMGTEWRIEARDKSTGSLVSSVTSSFGADVDYAYAIAIDPDKGYMYVAGSDSSSGDLQWRIEKRTLSAPLSLETATFGGGQGFVIRNPGTGADEPLAIALDKNRGFLYIAGYEYDAASSHYRWRIEKRHTSNGLLETTQFGGSNGFVVSNTTTNAVANSITIDSNYLYVAGYDNSSGSQLEWRIEKRSLTTGELISSFGNGGVVVNDFAKPSLRHSARAIEVDSSYIYVAGYEGISPTESRWRIMKLVK